MTNSVRRQATYFQRGRRLSNRHEGEFCGNTAVVARSLPKLLRLIVVVTSVTWSFCLSIIAVRAVQIPLLSLCVPATVKEQSTRMVVVPAVC